MFIFAALFNQITFTAMAKPKFQLRAPAATTPTLILLVYRFGDNKFVYSTGESIHPDNWDKATQRAKTNLKGNKTQLENNKATNLQLERYSVKLTEILSALSAAKQQPAVDFLRGEMDKEFKKHQPREKSTFFEWFDNWIANVKLTRENPPKPINKRTTLKYRTTLKTLQDFANLKRKGKLNFDDIDLDFYGDFVEYLAKEKNHTPNTVGKYIKTLKTMMREAFDAGITTNQAIEKRKFAAPKEPVEHIYLTEAELDKLYNLNLSKKPSLDRVRDLFLIGSFTALRFSDFTAIKPENIITTSTGGRALKIKTMKTGKKVIIPIHPRVEEILAKYDNNIPRPISNQKMNDYLKDIAKMEEAGLQSPVEITKMVKGTAVKTAVPKWQLVTTHTARRSGATNMYLAGIPAISIMKITGHKTESVFMKYICIDEEQNANLLMQHDYFRPKMKIV
jgi:integrase